ncbi:hypothetical protein ACFE04_018293 [Oxalis oulophora]
MENRNIALVDLLGPASSDSKSKIAKKKRFRSLKLVNVDLEQELSQQPFGAAYGRLDNGLSYYVRCNPKPRMRAALALAVNVGSVLEEECERGVAHIVEHLAFSATKKYTNHDIVKFLESIGSEFGPCQNAWTSADATVYELLVPVDKPELLSEATSVLAEFCTEIRASKDDLEKERGAVMEEYRGNRNASGRTQDAYWALLMEGSKYADRLPIGLEKVIKTVSSETVKQFYQKWYHLHNMAVIAVGDFSDTETVVELIKKHFGEKISAPNPPIIPKFLVPPHEEPRFSCFVESEASGSAVMISYKMPAPTLKTLKDGKDLIIESMFLRALSQRLFKISRRKDPPYFSCSAAAEDLVSPLKACIMSSSCKVKRTVEALESMLMEVARVRIHGFSEREISIVRALLMSDIESAYLERDQMQSTYLRDEYLQHFLNKRPVIGIELEAQLQKTILAQISVLDVSKCAERLRTSCSCVIKIIEPQASATIDDLKNVVSKINTLEDQNCISPWDDEQVPEEIVSTKPNPGNIINKIEYSNIGATELTLSNGMRVCYKSTDFLDDQVIFTGFSHGGLSELRENEYYSCSKASSIAAEIGVFGYKPSVLTDMLAGKRVEVDTQLDVYMRTFYGSCSPSDLETALQLVYQLFTINIAPDEEDVKIVMQMAEEAIHANERDPYTAFSNRVTEINYGDSYFFRPTKISDLRKVDPLKACDYFNSCFKDPSTFTVVIVGNIDPSNAIPLVLQYLGGIPKPPKPIFHLNRDDLKGLPFTFPTRTIREIVCSQMVEEQCSVQLCFPVELKNEKMAEESHRVQFLSKLIETNIMQVLRFKHGKIYSADVYAFFDDHYKPAKTGCVHGDISVNFSCDPEFSSKLLDFALDEISRLQIEGPSDQDLSSVLEIEQRAHENGMQENYYWLEMILNSYQTKTYLGNVGTSYEIQDEARTNVRNSLTPSDAQSYLRKILPYPCKSQYTAVILMPKRSRFKFLDIRSRDAKILAGLAGFAVLAISLWRHSRHALKS